MTWIAPMTLLMTLVMTSRGVSGHGMMMDPVQRSSVWRLKEFYGAPTNYNDNALYCGGFYRQWYVNGGRCGVCGDDYSSPHPRDKEAGGTYGRAGVIVRTYRKADVIDVTVKLTANHLGYFVFKLCPRGNNASVEASHECLDKHVLQVVGEHSEDAGQRFYVDAQSGLKYLRLRLPKKVTCSHCVLQWTYTSGNSWGCGDTGCCVGCGPQENFVNCADIAIVDSD